MAKALDDADLKKAGAFRGRAAGLVLVDLDADDTDEHDTPQPSPPRPPLVPPSEARAALVAALLSPASFVVIRSTPGAGKSASQREVIRDHVRAKGRVVVSVPTLDLATQTAEALWSLKIDATAPVGAARVRLHVVGNPSDAARACIHAEAADLLAQGGARVRQTLCAECPAREAHPVTGGECPAYAKGADKKAPVAVLQHATLAAVLAEHTAKLRAPDKPASGKRKRRAAAASLFVIDEQPSLTSTLPLAGALADYRKLAADLRPEVREQLEPLLLAMLDGAARAADGASVAELVALAGRDAAYIDGALAEARDLDGVTLWQPDLHKRLARFAVGHAGNDAVVRKLRRLARITALCEAIVDAAHASDRPALWVDEQGVQRLVVAARWTRRVRAYLDAGGKVRFLDATANEAALRALWGDAFEFVRLDVADAPGVDRQARIWQHAPRGRHTARGAPIAEQVRGPLRYLAQVASERGARKVAIFTDKPTALALRAWLDAPPGVPAPALVPAELVALVASGVALRVGHYGAQRGLDAWADCDLVATLGDPWPNLGEARAQALALGIDPGTWAREQAMAELIQAWGRARAVHRKSPVLVLHLGSKALQPTAATAPQWAGVEPSKARRGAPSSVRPPSDPSRWAEEREAKRLSARAHAASLGIEWRTYRRLAAEASTENTPKTPGGGPGHKWATDVFEGVSGAPEGAQFSIPICAPPLLPGNPAVSEGSPSPEPTAPAPASGPRRQPRAPVEASAALAASGWGVIAAGALGGPLGAPACEGYEGAWVA